MICMYDQRNQLDNMYLHCIWIWSGCPIQNMNYLASSILFLKQNSMFKSFLLILILLPLYKSRMWCINSIVYRPKNLIDTKSPR